MHPIVTSDYCLQMEPTERDLDCLFGEPKRSCDDSSSADPLEGLLETVRLS